MPVEYREVFTGLSAGSINVFTTGIAKTVDYNFPLVCWQIIISEKSTDFRLTVEHVLKVSVRSKEIFLKSIFYTDYFHDEEYRRKHKSFLLKYFSLSGSFMDSF